MHDAAKQRTPFCVFCRGQRESSVQMNSDAMHGDIIAATR
jgi:hypothetical protein